MASGGNVNLSFGVVKDQVAPAIDKQTRAYKESKRAIDEVTGGYRQLETEAVRALKRAGSEQVKVNRAAKGLERLVAKGVITQEAMNNAIRVMKERLDGTAAAREKDLRAAERIKRQINPQLADVKEINRLRKQGVLSLEDARRRIGQIFRSTRQAKEQTKGWIDDVVGVASAYVGVHAAITKAIELLQQQRDLEKGAADETLSVAQAQAVLTRNTADFTVDQRQQFLSGISDVSRQIDTATVAQITAAAAKGISATIEDERGAAGRIEDTLTAVRQAAELSIEDPEGIVPLTQSILDLQNATRGVISNEESLELLLRAGSQSRIVDTENLRNLIPALQAIRASAENAGVQLTKEDLVEGFAVQALIGSITADPNGELTRTASTLLVQNAAENITQAGNFAEQLRLARENKELQDLVVSELQGRGATKPAAELVVRNLGSGSKLDEVRDALNRPGETVRQFLLDGTEELARQSAVRSAEAGTTDFRERRFGQAGFRRKQVEQALGTFAAFEALDLRALAFAAGGTQTGAQAIVNSAISRADLDLFTARTEEQRKLIREQLDELRRIRASLNGPPPNQQQALPPPGRGQ